MRSAVSVGTMPAPERTKSGSPARSRRRLSAADTPAGACPGGWRHARRCVQSARCARPLSSGGLSCRKALGLSYLGVAFLSYGNAYVARRQRSTLTGAIDHEDLHGPKTIRFIRRGEPSPPGQCTTRSHLLEVLREDLGCTGTKEGCGEGDCGACTVVLGEARDGKLRLPRHQQLHPAGAFHRRHGAVDGGRPGRPDGTLHPAQEAMVQCHGSQCGFCTPGFVMSLFGMYQNHVARAKPSPARWRRKNCRATCAAAPATGRSWTRAADGRRCRPCSVDEGGLLRTVEQLAGSSPRRFGLYWPRADLGLLAARAAHPQAQIVAGCTDVGLWVTKMHRQFAQVLDVTQVPSCAASSATRTTSPSAQP
jgi:xanthine dehydrogenase iron-sulfur cluster and FAD-binding subunit A